MRIRSLLVVLVLSLVSALPLFAQLPASTQAEVGQYLRANYTKREVMIPVRDGVKLFTVIYEPKDKSQKYPILLNRTPYT
ncbi:MAG: hypothetical protein IT174_17435, partial [Acidobacteria bacterium]|nr:hypothetical protein [Acidobacteriota bacterium]